MLAFSEISLSFRNERDEKKFPGIEKVWEYLKKRGIDRGLADRAGLHIMQAVELIAAARRSANVMAVDNRAAVVFPHYKLGGGTEPIEWWSARLVPLAGVETLRVVASFGDLVERRPMGKMFCPPNEPPRGYIPPETVFAWGGLRNEDRVYIHESCIKALNGAVRGYASVGLNGVWGWCSKKHNIALVEELRDIPWKARKLTPCIVYDSNVRDNEQVQRAEAALAAKLHEITGQTARAFRVPKRENGEDRGFDDFCVEEGDDRVREFLEGDGEEIDIDPRRQMLMELNEKVAVVMELKRVAEVGTGALMTRGEFCDLNYADMVTWDEDRPVNVPKQWLAWEGRRVVGTLEYAPGEARMVRRGGGLPNLNTWAGMGRSPERGDVDPWLELLVNNVASEELREWITAWCAYPLQHLGAKMNTYLLMFGPSGTGKNLFFRPLHLIYGENAVLVDTDALKSSFTSLYAQRQLVHADELVRARGEEDTVSQRIKAMVTQEKITVNRKGQPEYKVDNHINLAITSNYWDCVKLDVDDRRACVVRWGGGDVGVDRRGDQTYWQNYVRWVDGGGAEALYWYLLEKDISGFDPTAWAPATAWKEQVKEASMGPMELWARDLWADPKSVLPLPAVDRAVWTSKELGALYYGKSTQEMSQGESKAIGNVLRNAGFVQANGGKSVKRTKADVPERFWVIQKRDQEWGPQEVNRHLKMFGI